MLFYKLSRCHLIPGLDGLEHLAVVSDHFEILHSLHRKCTHSVEMYHQSRMDLIYYILLNRLVDSLMELIVEVKYMDALVRADLKGHFPEK